MKRRLQDIIDRMRAYAPSLRGTGMTASDASYHRTLRDAEDLQQLATTLDELIVEVAAMRDHQRMFFRATPGTGLRQASLQASKQCEQRVDRLLQRLRGSQGEMVP